MAKKRAGYEYQLFIGTAGSGTATNQLTNATDISYKNPLQKNPTTVRGDGSAVPITTEDVTQIGAEISFTMLAKDDDAHLITLTAAARTGGKVCMKCHRYSGGGTGFLGDVNVEIEEDATLTGSQEVKFKCTANDAAGVAPQTNAAA